MNRLTVLFIFGTRPEAIKLYPLVRELRSDQRFRVRICATAQHRYMLDQVLAVFGVSPDHDLGVMEPHQTLALSTSRMLAGLAPVIAQERPNLIVVQGDTTTTLCGALSGFYERVPVGHVEAGLRTGDINQPFPEEMNRILVTKLSALHFAATDWAAGNLRAENIPERQIWVTGNTSIDAVLQVSELLSRGQLSPERNWSTLSPNKKLILVTAHRRENFGPGLERICAALLALAKRDDVQIVYPVHPNPNVAGPVRSRLQGAANIELVKPLDYISFVDLLRRSSLVLTDSGGVQEEAPSLGKPVLVLREKTERPEGVEAGTVSLVGTDVHAITQQTERLLDDASEYERRSRIHNPYGNGQASRRIAEAIRQHWRL
jgi:UDP-N-acetylglucosamine 2-epimerase (non-hydrolysing)